VAVGVRVAVGVAVGVRVDVGVGEVPGNGVMLITVSPLIIMEILTHGPLGVVVAVGVGCGGVGVGVE
jgi:hypothetical protein